jgi:IS1 family transposase
MNNILIIILTTTILFIILLYFQSRKKQLKVLNEKSDEKPGPKPLVYKPKSEKDRPCCQANHPNQATTHQMPIPWNQVKGKGGRKKTIATEGYFCSNECCDYFGITDQNIHAVVGNGKRGKAELIQYLKCNACTDRFTSRKHTMMYCLKTPSEKVGQALHLTVLGIDIAAIQDFSQIRESTIRSWLTRSGEHGQKLHDRFVTGLKPKHIQLDELWASVRNSEQDVWVWTVCDATTKLMPVIELGGRTQSMAYAVVHQLKTRMHPGHVPVFSSDGLKHYFYALTAHFGEWIRVEGKRKPVWKLLPEFIYGQVLKYRKRKRIIEIQQRLLWGLPKEYRSRLKAAGLTGRINTSFVERANLTLRQSISKLARRTWAQAHSSEKLREHLFWWLAYYHFSRYHQSLRTELSQPIQRKGRLQPIRYRRSTPAMAAGLTRRRWSIRELISYPLM